MDARTHHAQVNTHLARYDASGTFNIIESFGAIDPVIPARYLEQRKEASDPAAARLASGDAARLSSPFHAVAICDAGYRITYANDLFLDIFISLGIEQIISRDMTTLWQSPDTVQKVLAGLSENDVAKEEFEILDEVHNGISVKSEITLINDPQKRPLGFRFSCFAPTYLFEISSDDA